MTVPKYSNVCDALCQTKINKKMGICPSVKDGKPIPIIPANYKYFRQIRDDYSVKLKIEYLGKLDYCLRQDLLN